MAPRRLNCTDTFGLVWRTCSSRWIGAQSACPEVSDGCLCSLEYPDCTEDTDTDPECYGWTCRTMALPDKGHEHLIWLATGALACVLLAAVLAAASFGVWAVRDTIREGFVACGTRCRSGPAACLSGCRRYCCFCAGRCCGDGHNPPAFLPDEESEDDPPTEEEDVPEGDAPRGIPLRPSASSSPALSAPPEKAGLADHPLASPSAPTEKAGLAEHPLASPSAPRAEADLVDHPLAGPFVDISFK